MAVKKASPKKKKEEKDLIKPEEKDLIQKAGSLLNYLRKHYNTDPMKQFVEQHDRELDLYNNLYDRIIFARKRARMTDRDYDLFKFLHKSIHDCWKLYFKYGIAVPKSAEQSGNLGPQPVFNITIGAPDQMQLKSAHPGLPDPGATAADITVNI